MQALSTGMACAGESAGPGFSDCFARVVGVWSRAHRGDTYPRAIAAAHLGALGRKLGAGATLVFFCGTESPCDNLIHDQRCFNGVVVEAEVQVAAAGFA